MKRRTVNLLFGAAALVCAGAALVQTLALSDNQQINSEISQLRQLPAGQKLPAATIESTRVDLARAVVIARSEKVDAATEAYNSVISQSTDGSLARTALFNLGNMYLREAIRLRSGGSTGSLPMIELAKQRYRDLLKMAPDDWDARFNLERALRLAPETGEATGNTDKVIKERRRVLLRGMSSVRLP